MTTDDWLPSPPDAVAELTAALHTRPVEVVLTDAVQWPESSLVPEVEAHRDPVTTLLRPGLEDGPGEVLRLIGHRLSKHDEPGDTLVTYSLVLQLPAAGKGKVIALWHEDHQEMPTSLFLGGGTLEPGRGLGASRLDLRLQDVDGDDQLTVSGLLRRW